MLVCERDRENGPLVALLRSRALAHGWWLREVQDLDACLEILHGAEPAVLVLEVGPSDSERHPKRLEREFDLIARVTTSCPGAAVVVVAGVENVALSNLAWDLGAAYVLFPPMPLELLPDVVVGLMRPHEAFGVGNRP